MGEGSGGGGEAPSGNTGGPNNGARRELSWAAHSEHVERPRP